MGTALNLRLSTSPIAPELVSSSPLGINTQAIAVSTTKVAATLLSDMVAGSNSDTITDVGYYQSTMGTVHTNGFKIGIQGIDNTTGNPNGTYLGGGSPASAEFIPTSGNNGKWVWVTLANTISISRGQAIALVIEAGSGYTAADSLTVGASLSLATRPAFGVSQTNLAGSWTKSTSATPFMGYKSAASAYGWPLQGARTVKTFGGTVEAALIFSIPTNFCSTFKLKGGVGLIETGSGGARNFTVSVYDLGNSPSNAPNSPPTQTTITTFDGDFMSASGSGGRHMEWRFDSTSPPALTAGNYYAIGFQETSASDSGLSVMDVTTQNDFQAWPLQTNCQYGQRATAAYANPQTSTVVFTLTNTSRPYVDLILDDLTAPAGGGGPVGQQCGM